jgi:ABC-type nickel/cobalt efflux system permease component RcnA
VEKSFVVQNQIAQSLSSPASTCAVHITTVSVSDFAFVHEAAAAAAQGNAPYAFVLVGEMHKHDKAHPHGHEHQHEHEHSHDGNAHTAHNVHPDMARFLEAASPSPATNGTTTATYGVRIVPEVITGLLLGLFMLFVVIIGLQCTMAINIPDVMHSTTLPAGKEY